MNLRVSAIYPAFQGEQNLWGIGTPVVFLRLSGCHLRCYLNTKGTLCDTPEALDKHSGNAMTIEACVEKVIAVSEQMGGVKRICLTGGDPLARSVASLHELFIALAEQGFDISVETSGTLSIEPFLIHNQFVSWVIDYKGLSTGVFGHEDVFLHNTKLLTEKDIVKFVIADVKDYVEMLVVTNHLNTKAKVVAGVYQGVGASLSTLELFNMLNRDSLLHRIHINMQTHKFSVPDYFINPDNYREI